MTIKERILQFIDFLGEQKGRFFDAVGIASSSFRGEAKHNDSINGGSLVKILTIYPNLSANWLILGEGPMLKSDIAGPMVAVELVPDTEMVDIPTPPIISAALSRRPNVDILEVVQQSSDDMETCPIRVDGMAISFWHRVRDNSLEPEYHKDDKLALLAYPRGAENPLPGHLYAIDTFSNGIIIRRLYPHPDGYIGRSFDPDNYPDAVFRREDIIRVYRVLFLARSV